MTSQRHNTDAALDRPLAGERQIPVEVLDATRAAVLAVGVRRTTLTDVARRAGVSRMTLYRLVPDVTTLILEVMTREFAALIAESEQHVRRRRSGPAPAGAAAGAGAAGPGRAPRPSSWSAGCRTPPCSGEWSTSTQSSCCPISPTGSALP